MKTRSIGPSGPLLFLRPENDLAAARKYDKIISYLFFRTLVNTLLGTLLSVGLITTPVPDKWLVLGEVPMGKYEVNLATLKSNKQQGTVQFDMRFTFLKPIGTTKYIIQKQLLLCREDILIGVAEMAYNEKNQLVDAGTDAVVYHNQHNDSIVSKLLSSSCVGITPQSDPTPIPREKSFPDILGKGRRYTT